LLNFDASNKENYVSYRYSMKITNVRMLMNKRIKYRKFRKRTVIYNRSSREKERERGRERKKEKNNESRERLANARLN